jgi:hypothetical protein
MGNDQACTNNLAGRRGSSSRSRRLTTRKPIDDTKTIRRQTDAAITMGFKRDARTRLKPTAKTRGDKVTFSRRWRRRDDPRGAKIREIPILQDENKLQVANFWAFRQPRRRISPTGSSCWIRKS